jgi:CheY-like chemotaxis protein
MSAPEAFESFRTREPDILISDIGLAQVDGYQLLEQFRQQNASDRAAIPAIALTAFAGTEDRRRALRAGYQAHLVKPIDSGDLVATVASFAELIKTQRAGARDDQ